MMGRQTGDGSRPFYLFNLEERIPARHLLRLTNPPAAPACLPACARAPCWVVASIAYRSQRWRADAPHQISFLKLLHIGA